MLMLTVVCADVKELDFSDSYGISICRLCNHAHVVGLRSLDYVRLHLPANSQAEASAVAESRSKRL